MPHIVIRQEQIRYRMDHYKQAQEMLWSYRTELMLGPCIVKHHNMK